MVGVRRGGEKLVLIEYLLSSRCFISSHWIPRTASRKSWALLWTDPSSFIYWPCKGCPLSWGQWACRSDGMWLVGGWSAHVAASHLVQVTEVVERHLWLSRGEWGDVHRMAQTSPGWPPCSAWVALARAWGQSLAPDTLVWHGRQAIIIWLPEGHILAGSDHLLWLFRHLSGQWILFPLSNEEPQVWKNGRCVQVIKLSWNRDQDLFAPVSVLFLPHLVDLKSSNILWWYYREMPEALFTWEWATMHGNYNLYL